MNEIKLVVEIPHLAEVVNLLSKLLEQMEAGNEKANLPKAEKPVEEQKNNSAAITFEDISNIAKKKGTEGKTKEVKALMNSLGIKKISEIPNKIPVEKYQEVMEKLEAI